MVKNVKTNELKPGDMILTSAHGLRAPLASTVLGVARSAGGNVSVNVRVDTVLEAPASKVWEVLRQPQPEESAE